MGERLGDVLYWAGCLVAFPILAICGYSAQYGTGDQRWWPIGLFAAIAICVWLVGRSCRYILAGR